MNVLQQFKIINVRQIDIIRIINIIDSYNYNLYTIVKIHLIQILSIYHLSFIIYVLQIQIYHKRNSNYLSCKYYSKQNYLFLYLSYPRTNLTMEFTNLTRNLTWKLVRSMIISVRIGGQTLQRFISRHTSTYPSPTVPRFSRLCFPTLQESA